MTDEEKVARLAAILGVEGAVQFGRFRGFGERSHKRGHREARLGACAGDGPTDADALRALVGQMEQRVAREPECAARSGAQAVARASEARFRAEAEGHEAEVASFARRAETVVAQYAAYRADCAAEGEA